MDTGLCHSTGSMRAAAFRNSDNKNKLAGTNRCPLVPPSLPPGAEIIADFGGGSTGLRFGLASAPAHSEDRLNDGWERFAQQGNVAAFEVGKPYERLRFWSEPEVELDLVAQSGAKVFRTGLDWARLVPIDPRKVNKPCSLRTIQNTKAMKRYKDILRMVRERGLEGMVTMFHHSLPKWAIDDGGWTNPEIKELFIEFAMDLMDEFSDLVDYWIPFNEPAIFAALSYAVGMWPTDTKGKSPFDQRFSNQAIDHMVEAHRRLYQYKIDKSITVPMGIAKFTGKYTGVGGIPSRLVARIAGGKVNHDFVDRIADCLDFMGINYYGEERIKNFTIVMDPRAEYTENGKAINPDGLYRVLHKFHDRYNVKKVGRKEAQHHLPIYVTENGIADSTDLLRPAYMIEHLLAIHKARQEGVPVGIYTHWTTSDNWEWADGYGPQFGLCKVERDNDLRRVPRESYYLYKQLAESGVVTQEQRDHAWKLVQDNIDKDHPIYRAIDGRSSLKTPRYIPIKDIRGWGFRA